MGRLEAILAVTLAISMVGCVLTGKPKIDSPPQPSPQPVEQPKPAPPPEPLSIPQTHVQLPSAPPVNLEALNSIKPPEPVEPAAITPKPPRRTVTASPPTAPKPEVVTPVATPTEPERPPIEAIVSPDENRRYKEMADSDKREIKQILGQTKKRRLTSEQTKTVIRINSFVAQSEDADKRGDMRQAQALAERGVVLARGLAGGQ